MRTSWVVLCVATLSFVLSVSAEASVQGESDPRSAELGSFPAEAPHVGRRGLLDDGSSGITALLELSNVPSYGYYYGGASQLDGMRRRLLADMELESLTMDGPGAYGYGYSYGSSDSSFSRRLLATLDDAGLLSEVAVTPGYGGYGYYPSTSRRLLSSDLIEKLGRRLLSDDSLTFAESEGSYGYGYYSSGTSRRLLSVNSAIDAVRRTLLASEDSLLTSVPGSGGYGYYYGGDLPSRRLLATQLEAIHRKLLADDESYDMLNMGSAAGSGYGYYYGGATSMARRLLSASSETVEDVRRKLLQ